MTNLEKWKEELLKIKYDRINYLHPAVVNGKPVHCAGMNCSDCDLNSPCSDSFIKWLFNEYTEPKKLTRRQRAFCEAVEKGWIARDRQGSIYIFDKKPYKRETVWYKETNVMCIQASFFPEFPFIKWEDAEPYSIEEMLTWEIEDED